MHSIYRPAGPGLCISDTLSFTEVAGPVFQGEGPSLGRAASVVRLGGCTPPCRCAAGPARPVAQVLDDIDEHETDLVVIVGDEPLQHQQQDGWRQLLDGLDEQGRRVQIETPGTVLPDSYTVGAVAGFTVAPPPARAGWTQAWQARPQVLEAFRDTGKAHFRFTCRTAGDVEAVFALTWPRRVYPNQVWIAPEGSTPETVAVTTRNVAPAALRYRFNLSPRLHVLLGYGGAR